MHVENFMTITEASINFSDKGLVLVEGVNNTSEAFESNGAGKSTLFSEAPVWGLYGVTIRGKKGDTIINRSVGKNTKVSLQIIDDNGDNYVIERHRKHKEHKNHVRLFRNDENITGKSDKDTDQMIVDLLQMDYSTFTNSIMFGQGVSKMFANSTDGEQKKILENMLQIDIYKACQDLAKSKLSEAESNIKNLTEQINLDSNTKITSEKLIEDLQLKEANLEEEIKNKASELLDEWEGYIQELQMLPDLLSLQGDGDNYKKLIEQLTLKIDEFNQYEDSKSDLIGERKSLERDRAKVAKHINDRKKELADIQSGKNVPKLCETCGQDLPLEDTSHVENHLKETIRKLGMEWQEKKDELEEIEGLIQKIDLVLQGKVELQNQRSELQNLLSDIELEILLSVKREQEIEKAKGKLEKQMSDLESQLGTTYTDVIESTLSQLEPVKERLKENNKLLNEYTESADNLKFWVDAYGNTGIKSVMLDSVVPFLNTRANYYLQTLADSSIEVTFNTQQTLKTGEKRDKFSVEVYNANGDDDYAGNSGGEKRRIDVAVNMALQDLVLNRSNKKIDLIVYDEVYEGLDEIGCHKVIELLEEKARSVGSIYVITHNPHLKQMFTKSITISKENGGTHIEE